MFQPCAKPHEREYEDRVLGKRQRKISRASPRSGATPATPSNILVTGISFAALGLMFNAAERFLGQSAWLGISGAIAFSIAAISLFVHAVLLHIKDAKKNNDAPKT